MSSTAASENTLVLDPWCPHFSNLPHITNGYSKVGNSIIANPEPLDSGAADGVWPVYFPNTGPLATLPDEVLQNIFSHTDLITKYRAFLTCKNLRRFLWRDWARPVRGQPVDKRYDFYSLVARYKPMHWACYRCGELHDWIPNDTPAIVGQHVASLPDRSFELPKIGILGYNLCFRHVNQALKWSRLGPPYNTPGKLGLLMEPATFTASRPGNYVESVYVKPEIVSGQFLLYVRKDYTGDLWNCLHKICQTKLICNHIHLHGYETPVEPHRSMEARPEGFVVVGDEEPGAVRQVTLPGRLRFYSDERSWPTNVMLDAEPNQGFCALCPTDWRIHGSKEMLTFETWQDMGNGENMAKFELHEDWGIDGPCKLRGIWHEPGSVRHKIR